MEKTILLIIGIILTIVLLYKSKDFLKDLIKNMKLIIGLSTSDLKVKYAGSYLGIIWAFAQPILTTFIYWFVFQVGFRLSPVEEFPFILWLVTGLVPWFFFSDVLMSGTGSMLEYSYLVKKVMFRVDILPAVKIIAGVFIHTIFVLFVLLFYLLCDVPVTLYALQIVYYSFCLIMLVTGMIYITATLNVFVKDTIQVVSVVMQLLFWMTPIVWDLDIMPATIQNILQLNPLCYVVMGYRDALINQVWFWEKSELTILFWFVTGCILYAGTSLFRKLKVHFADVL